MALESGRERVYHIDLYEFESHSTLDMRNAPPSYEEARALALNALQ
jgi:tRNA A37 threonylcarbamoyladenosine biosynthesis protein TsaE